MDPRQNQNNTDEEEYPCVQQLIHNVRPMHDAILSSTPANISYIGSSSTAPGELSFDIGDDYVSYNGGASASENGSYIYGASTQQENGSYIEGASSQENGSYIEGASSQENASYIEGPSSQENASYTNNSPSTLSPIARDNENSTRNRFSSDDGELDTASSFGIPGDQDIQANLSGGQPANNSGGQPANNSRGQPGNNSGSQAPNNSPYVQGQLENLIRKYGSPSVPDSPSRKIVSALFEDPAFMQEILSGTEMFSQRYLEMLTQTSLNNSIPVVLNRYLNDVLPPLTQDLIERGLLPRPRPCTCPAETRNTDQRSFR